MANAILATHVYLSDPERGTVALRAGEAVPDWAIEHVTNPKAWVGGVRPETPKPDETPRKRGSRS